MKKAILVSVLFFSLLTYSNRNHILEYKLENGLTVIINNDSSVSKAFGVVLVRAGSKNDPDDFTGIAHYLEHMIFKGTDKIGSLDWEKEKPLLDKISILYDTLNIATSENKIAETNKKINLLSIEAAKYSNDSEFTNLIKEIGGVDLNAGTSFDFTMYYSSFTPWNLEEWLNLYSSIFINPVFRNFQSELEVVYEEKNVYNDNLGAFLGQMLLGKIFKNHPYGQKPILGKTSHIKAPSMSEMKRYYDSYYVPNNMALVISGNFDIDTLKTLIKEKFGVWKPKPVPKFKEYKEKDFVGREYESIDLNFFNIIEVGAMVFRTVPSNHPDKPVLDVITKLLSNSNRSGFVDEITLRDDALASGFMDFSLNDHGIGGAYFVPNFTFFFSEFEDCENAILKELERVKNIDFSDELLTSTKLNLYKDQSLYVENLDGEAEFIGESFLQNIELDSSYNYVDRINAVTKEDIKRVAKKYYSDNYFITKIGLGFPFSTGVEKIKKPSISPILKDNDDKQSKFAIEQQKIIKVNNTPKFADFEKDIVRKKLKKGMELFYKSNKKNSVFSFTLNLATDESDNKKMGIIADLMNSAYLKDLSLVDVKKEFYNLGCDYKFNYENNIFSVSLVGVDKNIEKSITLLSKILNNPVISEIKIEKFISRKEIERDFELEEPMLLIKSLGEYIKYGKKSKFIERLSIDDIEKIKPDLINYVMKSNCLLSPCKIHFYGNCELDKLSSYIDKLNITPLFDTATKNYRKLKDYKENTIIFVDNPGIVQSKIGVYIKGDKFNKDEDYLNDAFNFYFGGDFSSILIRELRKKRSLVYSVNCQYGQQKNYGDTCFFNGVLFTQADKTIDAINTLMGLINNMPVEPGKIDFVKKHLIESNCLNQPSLRKTSTYVEEQLRKGYTENPSILKQKKYNGIKFNDILNFYNSHIKNRTIVIGIVGDRDKIDIEKLKKISKFIELDAEDLYLDESFW